MPDAPRTIKELCEEAFMAAREPEPLYGRKEDDKPSDPYRTVSVKDINDFEDWWARRPQ